MDRYLITIPEIIFSLIELAFDVIQHPEEHTRKELKDELFLPLIPVVILFVIPLIGIVLLGIWIFS